MTAPTRWRFEAADAAKRLREAGDELDVVLTALGASERTRFAARLVAEEIVLNAFEHGGATRVTMEIDPVGDPQRLEFEDDGVPFDPSVPAARASSSSSPRGRGLILVHGMARSIEHRSVGGRNRLSVRLIEN